MEGKSPRRGSERHGCDRSDEHEHACMAGGYKARSQTQLDLQSSLTVNFCR
jgi:hypothetical protein